MCGIVGYLGHRQAVDVILPGLRRLEYRGYDSAGISILEQSELITTKRKGKVAELEGALPDGLNGTLGLGHTRWATHGEPSNQNAHPHIDSTGKIALVHNGIIENHGALRAFLEQQGRTFKTETDTEVLTEYIGWIYEQQGMDFHQSIREALTNIVGAYGIAAICTDEPDLMVGARLGSPLVVGVGDAENFLASDASPIIPFTRNVIFLDDGDLVVLTQGSYRVTRIKNNEPVDREPQALSMSLEQIEKGGHPHFMLKEIMEQSTTIPDAMRGRLDATRKEVVLGGIRDWIDRILDTDMFYITACGTSWHAGLIGSYLLEELAGIPTRVEYASEFRYRETLVGSRSTVLAISQSGETADTLAAVKKANESGALTMGIVNAVGSSIARETDCGVFIHAGPEIGVASTKAFTSQVTVLLLLALYLAEKRGTDHQPETKGVFQALADIGPQVQAILDQEDQFRELASIYSLANNFLYMGRGFQYPIALEGALKLKEISYIHAEGYPAAEMKHGPIALIDEQMPVVVLATRDKTFEKILANIQEIKARKGRIIAITDGDSSEIRNLADHVLTIPSTHRLVMPLLSVIPLQLLAYHIALQRGCDVDQPRNLAKSVTVE